MDNINGSLRTIQKLLGHENRFTTEIYIHRFGNMERNAIAQFEEAI
jgi:integrase